VLKTTITHSVNLDSLEAVEEVLDRAREELGDLRPQAGVLYAGIDHDFVPILEKINEAYPGIELIGATTDGEVSSVHGFADDSIVLTLFCSDEIEFKGGVVDNATVESVTLLTEAVEDAAKSMESKPVLCITTPTGWPGLITGEDVIAGIQKALGDSFPVFGGMAGDQYRFKGTYQFCNDTVYTGAVPFRLVAGPVLFSFGVESGWMPVGEKSVVTKSDYNVVYKIGEQSAMSFFKHYLGEGEWYPVSEYPLAVFDDEGFCLRSSLANDVDTGSITYTGPIPEGTFVQITHATRDKIVEAAKTSVDAAITDYPGTNPMLALCFSCTCRKQVLGTRIGEEYEILKKSNPDLAVAGFYTYGEIGPAAKDKSVKLHNDTMYTLLLGID